MENIEEKIKIFALENAIKFNGKANQGAIVGKLMSLDNNIKNNMKEISPIIGKIVSEINSLPLDKQKEELNLYDKEIKEKLLRKEDISKKNNELKELEEINEKGVIMRFAPSPSGPMHIGHAMTGGLTSLYVKKYGGKFILRIEDTNSDNIYIPAYNMLKQEGIWIFGNINEVWIQSDRLEIYYSYIKKFIEKNSAYLCSCSQEAFKEYSNNMEECPCRNLSKENQITRWENMLNGTYKEGEIVVRFKSDMRDKNPAMRDFPLARINESEHPRQGKKYRVWPLMNLSVTVDDIEAGMTHIIRAKDHYDNAKRQEMMYKVLEIKPPKTYFIGRIQFEGIEISCSKTKAKIEEGKLSGWDDIRVPFLASLKRRGYQPESFLRYTKDIGLSLNDKKVTGDDFFKSINSYNREILEDTTNRFFFIKEPINIEIENAPKLEIELDLHPDKRKGGRKFLTNNKFIIDKKDFESLEDGKIYRLIDCLNFKKEKDKFIFIEGDYEYFKSKNGKKVIHWLSNNNNIKVNVLNTDNNWFKGLAEENIKLLKEGNIVQFERFGFCRLDSIENEEYNFWFTHK
jgi:glutamyl-tRNA synthetase